MSRGGGRSKSKLPNVSIPLYLIPAPGGLTDGLTAVVLGTGVVAFGALPGGIVGLPGAGLVLVVARMRVVVKAGVVLVESDAVTASADVEVVVGVAVGNVCSGDASDSLMSRNTGTKPASSVPMAPIQIGALWSSSFFLLVGAGSESSGSRPGTAVPLFVTGALSLAQI